MFLTLQAEDSFLWWNWTKASARLQAQIQFKYHLLILKVSVVVSRVQWCRMAEMAYGTLVYHVGAHITSWLFLLMTFLLSSSQHLFFFCPCLQVKIGRISSRYSLQIIVNWVQQISEITGPNIIVKDKKQVHSTKRNAMNISGHFKMHREAYCWGKGFNPGLQVSAVSTHSAWELTFAAIKLAMAISRADLACDTLGYKNS